MRIEGDPIAANNGVFFPHSDHPAQRAAALRTRRRQRQPHPLLSRGQATDASGTLVARQLYDAWGNIRASAASGTMPTPSASLRGQADIGYTGQRLDATGLMYYRARYYASSLGRFVSADSIVPGAADGSGGGAGTLGVDSSSRLTTLTTDFHEFIGKVTQENQAVLQYGPFFQWSEKVRQDNPVPSGPLNPQALNRYSYGLNNPVKYIDPSGHAAQCPDCGGSGIDGAKIALGVTDIWIFDKLSSFQDAAVQ